MRVLSIEVEAFRSFETLPRTPLGNITVLVGANNSGKSSVLRALYVMQRGLENPFGDVRIGKNSARIIVEIQDPPITWGGGRSDAVDQTFRLEATISSPDRKSGTIGMMLKDQGGGGTSVQQLAAMEPGHVIVPYMSKRKTASYQEDVRLHNALAVTPDFGFLAAKLSRLANPSFPSYEQYHKTSEQVLGFIVTAIPSENGQRPGVYVNREILAIDQMGEGVPNIVGLLADLALAEGKLILIEGPENDLHPTALKALLDLIVSSSRSNQFVVSTHSNIVLRHLASAPGSLVYRVGSDPGRWPAEATLTAVGNIPEERLQLLQDLGYSFSDFDLWDGWLILEESSAERIIRDYLIPWFAPKLSRMRLVAAGGTGQVEATFSDFRRMVLFAHLEQVYRDCSWVRVDNDKTGFGVVEQLRVKYKDWDPERFGCFPANSFELFYPEEFAERVQSALAHSDAQQRRQAKKRLLDDVITWLDEDTPRGRLALERSASAVIQDLQRMEAELVRSARGTESARS